MTRHRHLSRSLPLKSEQYPRFQTTLVWRLHVCALSSRIRWSCHLVPARCYCWLSSHLDLSLLGGTWALSNLTRLHLYSFELNPYLSCVFSTKLLSEVAYIHCLHWLLYDLSSFSKMSLELLYLLSAWPCCWSLLICCPWAPDLSDSGSPSELSLHFTDTSCLGLFGGTVGKEETVYGKLGWLFGAVIPPLQHTWASLLCLAAPLCLFTWVFCAHLCIPALPMALAVPLPVRFWKDLSEFVYFPVLVP